MIMQELLALFRGLQLAYHHDHLCLCIIVDLIESSTNSLAKISSRDSCVSDFCKRIQEREFPRKSAWQSSSLCHQLLSNDPTDFGTTSPDPALQASTSRFQRSSHFSATNTFSSNQL
ncbi:uncharacterized protein LOC107877007 [Capsicum annuum]|uniref:uncharacterized protein LOC107877007 n=1 Tax=Capsicum annuum TaxID=4072 RepID=UPI001FB0DDCD|nr:uncharacterized protein LOC107877007 [Capsicum annuum]